MEAAAALRGLEGGVRAALAGLRGGPAREGGAPPGLSRALTRALPPPPAGSEVPAEGGGGLERGTLLEALRAAFGAASRAATQLSLAASARPGPGPQELERLCGEVQSAVWAAAAACSRLPQDQGRTLRKAVRDATVEVVEGLLHLVAALRSAPPPPHSLSQEQLVSTGGVWEACDRAAGLPRDNQAAVASALASGLQMVQDALRELEQALTEGGNPYPDVLEDEEMDSRGNRDTHWSEADRQLLGPCVGLVKAARASLKKLLGAVKTRGRVDTAEQVAQLDGLADAAGDVSPSVDELVLSTYPPVNQLTLRLNGGRLAAVLKKMLEIAWASHICVPSEDGWVQFLSGAVDHNMGKIKVMTQGVL